MNPTTTWQMLRYFALGLLLVSGASLYAGDTDSSWLLEGQGEGSLAFVAERDSLQDLLKSAPSDSARIDTLNAFANNFFDQSYELSLESATKALEAAREIGYLRGEIDAQVNLGQLNVNFAQNYPAGLAHLTEALALIDKGQQSYPGIEMNIFRLMGFLYYRQDRFEKGIEYLNKAAAVAEENDWKSALSDLRAYIADLYEVEGKMDLAMIEYRKILAQEEQNQFQDARPGAIAAIAHYYYLQKDYDKTYEIYQIALEKFRRKGYHRWTAYILSLIGELHIDLGQPQKGVKFAKEGLALATERKLTKEIGDCHHALANLYDTLGSYQQAYFHFKAETAINEEMFNLERTKELTSVQSSYEAQMRLQELEQVKREREMQQKRTRIVAVAGVCGILLISLLAIFWYSAYRQKKKVNTQLADRVELKDMALGDIVVKLRQEIELHKQTQARLETTHSELNHFIYKSSHDLKGPLATIVGLTDIAHGSITETERLKYLDLIRTSSSRLSTKLDALIHATRLTEGPLRIEKVNVAAQIRKIVDDLKQQDFATGVRVEIVAAPDLDINTDRHLSDSLLFSLIENAMQYKDVSKAGPFAKIKVQKEGNGVRIDISDNGRGIPAQQMDNVFDMFVKSNLEFQSSGLGLYLAKKTAYKLGGTIDLNSEEDVGTTASIFFPDQRQMPGNDFRDV